MISAQEIKNIEARRKEIKKETYQHILETFDKKIRKAVTIGQRCVHLSIPSFVLGYPTYDMRHAASYLNRQLKKLGYTVRFLSDKDILLSWGEAAPKSSVPVYEEPMEDDFPTLVNLRKIANKLQKQNPGGK